MTKSITKGLCQCGCGRPTEIASRNRKDLGWIKGEPLTYLRGHNRLAVRGPETPEGMKWCGTCQTVKPIADFARGKSQIDGLQGFCRSCGRERQAKWRASNREKSNWIAANCHRRKRLGISKETYNQMLAAQNGVCAICKDVCITKTTTGIQKSLAVDHDHNTGKVRGLLCARCNTAIGLLGDDPERLRVAVNYLIAYQ